jgi:hypothetical protein
MKGTLMDKSQQTSDDYDTKKIIEDASSSLRLAHEFGRNRGDNISLAVDAIEIDILDRGGIKHIWSEIDDDVKEIIRETWGVIISDALAGDLK